MRRLLLASLGLSILALQPGVASAHPWWRPTPGPSAYPSPSRFHDEGDDDDCDHHGNAVTSNGLRALLFRFDRARAMSDFYQLQILDNEARGLAQAQLRESQREAWAAQRRFDGRMGWAARRDLEQTRILSMELDSVAGRQDPAALDYRRERLVRLLALEDREMRGVAWRDPRWMGYERAYR